MPVTAPAELRPHESLLHGGKDIVDKEALGTSCGRKAVVASPVVCLRGKAVFGAAFPKRKSRTELWCSSPPRESRYLALSPKTSRVLAAPPPFASFAALFFFFFFG